MNRERAVVLTMRDGESVCGILHEPDRPCTLRTGVHLLNPGLKTRVAPNRLNVILARRLVALGYYVLRIDPPGIGDSSGSLPEHPRHELWRKVEQGMWAGFIDEVNKQFKDECDLEELILIGNCGGAITALLAAVESSNVEKLVLVDIPVNDRAEDADAGAEVFGKQQGGRILASYLRRCRDPGAWSRLFSLKTDFRIIGRALAAKALGRRRLGTPGRNRVDGSMDPLLKTVGINRRFAKAFIDFHQRGGRILFVHAGDDDATSVFDRLVGDRFMAAGLPLAQHQRIVIPGPTTFMERLKREQPWLQLLKIGWGKGSRMMSRRICPSVEGSGMIALAGLMVLALACGGESMDEGSRSYAEISNVQEADWRLLASKKIYFGHQSVGRNIVQGIGEVLAEYPEIGLTVLDLDEEGSADGAGFTHSANGANKQPLSKIEAFRHRMDSGLGGEVDIAFFKFCYVDIRVDTDVDALFATYRDTMADLEQRYPDTTFLHVTVPLTTVQTGPKAWVKKMIGRPVEGVNDNISRHRFNRMLVQHYGENGTLFDLAAVESTLPDGGTVSFKSDGGAYPVLAAQYTYDGGHLNEYGRKRVAEHLLLFLAHAGD